MKEATQHDAPDSLHDAARNQRLMAMMLDALERAPAERQAYVRTVSDDPALCEEALELIAAHERAGEFMARPEAVAPVEAATPAGLEDIGSHIGRYELVRLIGEGGFGRVYEARQREPLVRQVALKVIKLGMDTRQVIARFEAERQALAMMDHPGIARVIDAGATETGRPYFVMELVDGVSITTCCDQRHLPLAERLDLFSQVCAAVQHAHMKGIIHRDLKPSNVLVQEHHGWLVPKVIDFGIAKAAAAAPGLTERTLMTECRQFLGTPQYMSPEQADPAAVDIDTRTDVYSLGVMLYELLTGETPFDAERLRSSTFDEVQRILREEDPPRPSTRLSAQRSSRDGSDCDKIEQRRLANRIRGDLDWITLKAVDKDRDRRYSSPAELAEDIRRHLHHEPVLAAPRGMAYRVGKLMRRHRGKVITTTIMALALLIGSVGTLVGLVQARRAAQRATAVNEFMRDVLTTVDPDSGGADVRLVEVLRNASFTVSQQFAGQPDLEAEVRTLLGQVFGRLDMRAESIDQYEKALAIWRTIAGPDDLRTLNAHLKYVGAFGTANASRDIDNALSDLGPRIERIVDPDDPLAFEYHRLMAVRHMARAEFDDAERILREALQRAETSGVDETTQIALLDTLVLVVTRRTSVQPPQQSHAQRCELERLARELVARSSRHDGPESLLALRALVVCVDLANDRGAYDEALQASQSILAASTQRLGPCHTLRVRAMMERALTVLRLGDPVQAGELCLRSIECLRTKGALGNLHLLSSMNDAIPFLDRGHQWVEGEALARELSDTLHQYGEDFAPLALAADCYIARFVSLQDRLDEADQLFASLLAREEQAATNIQARAYLHLYHGSHLVKRRQFEQAEQSMRLAAELLGQDRVLWSNHPDAVCNEFIALYDAWGEQDKADEYRRMRAEAIARH